MEAAAAVTHLEAHAVGVGAGVVNHKHAADVRFRKVALLGKPVIVLAQGAYYVGRLARPWTHIVSGWVSSHSPLNLPQQDGGVSVCRPAHTDSLILSLQDCDMMICPIHAWTHQVCHAGIDTVVTAVSTPVADTRHSGQFVRRIDDPDTSSIRASLAASDFQVIRLTPSLLDGLALGHEPSVGSCDVSSVLHTQPRHWLHTTAPHAGKDTLVSHDTWIAPVSQCGGWVRTESISFQASQS